MAKSGPLAGYRELVQRGEITADPVQEDAATWLQTLHDALARYRPGKGPGLMGLFFRRAPDPRGIYICGDVGRGKSMLMDIFFETAPIDAKRRVHFYAFMQEVHGAIKQWRDLPKAGRRTRRRALGLKGYSDDPLQPVAKQIADGATMLCFDEFQVEDVADALILGRLFEALFSFGVIVVATSNRPPHDLYMDGLNRQLFLPFVSLLQSKLDIFHLNASTDYRTDRVKGMEVYFTPLDGSAESKMNSAWAAVTGGAEAKPCAIKVKSRTLRLKACAGGAMREEFANLCGKALGPADYLAITKQFHTVLIDRIPIMPKAKRNEAKRFVALIDIFYENQITLIVSAEGTPDELYPSGSGSFEFARTASRLKEMQAQDYLTQAPGS